MIIYRYIILQSTIATLLVWLSLITLMFVFEILGQMGNIDEKFTIFNAVVYTFLKVPILSFEIFPVAVLIGVMSSLGSFSANSELVILRVNNYSLGKVVGLFMLPLFLMAVTLVFINDYVFIKMQQQAEEYLHTSNFNFDLSDKAKSDLWLKENNKIIHLRNISGKQEINGVSSWIFNKENNMLEQFIYGKKAIHIGNKLNLIEPDQILYEEQWAKMPPTSQLQLPIGTDYNALFWMAVKNPQYLTTSQIYSLIQYLKSQNISYENYQYYFYKRIFYPFSIIALAILAASFVCGTVRHIPIGTRIFTGLIFGLIFRFFQELIGSISLVFHFNAIIMVMLPLVICTAIGIYLLRRNE